MQIVVTSICTSICTRMDRHTRVTSPGLPFNFISIGPPKIAKDFATRSRSQNIYRKTTDTRTVFERLLQDDFAAVYKQSEVAWQNQTKRRERPRGKFQIVIRVLEFK